MRHQTRTPTTIYDKARRVVKNNSGSARRQRNWLLWRLALLLLGIIFLCGIATCVTYLLQVRIETATTSAAGVEDRRPAYTNIGFQTTGSGSDGYRGGTSESLASSTRQRKLQQDGERQHLVSNLSVLLQARGWSSGARFHPAAFLPETEVLNKTVLCDWPAEDDVDGVYAAPTWLCKNIRIADQQDSPAALTQRLPFSDITSRKLEEMIVNRRKEVLGLNSWPASSDRCGHLPDRRDNVLLLCEMLLAGMPWPPGDENAWAVPPASSVHIPYGNCSFPEEKRILLVGMATSDAVWYTETNWKPGFVTDLYCSFAG